jgi:ER membrane protein complex subunit 3
MLQRGIETQDMDVRFVSSLSWYFLNFFGLNGLYRLILGNDNGTSGCHCHATCSQATPAADATRDMAMSPFANMAAQQAAPGQPQDFNKLFKAEKDNLEFSEGVYTWLGQDVEDRVLRKYGRLP